MGVIQQPIIAPGDGRTLDDTAFCELAVAIARGTFDAEYEETTPWVTPPFAIYRGDRACKFFLWDRSDLAPTWEGDDIDELAEALATAITDTADICVWYGGIADEGGIPGQCRLALRRTVEPVHHTESNSYSDDDDGLVDVTTRIWFEGEGKGAPLADDILDSELGACLRAAFGDHLVSFTSAM